MTTNLSGSLSEFSLAEVLSLLGMGGRTARMQVTTPDAVGTVHLVDGRISSATADIARAGLLRSVVAALPVPADDLAQALQAEDPVRALVDSGVVDRDASQQVAAEHCTGSVGEMLDWTSGEFAVWVGSQDPSDIGVRLAVDELVGAARERAQQWHDLRAALPESDRVLALVPEVASAPVLDLDDWAVLAKVDGRRTLAEVLSAMGASPLAAGDRLVQLMGRGLVAVQVDGGDAAKQKANQMLDAFDAGGPIPQGDEVIAFVAESGTESETDSELVPESGFVPESKIVPEVHDLFVTEPEAVVEWQVAGAEPWVVPEKDPTSTFLEGAVEPTPYEVGPVEFAEVQPELQDVDPVTFEVAPAGEPAAESFAWSPWAQEMGLGEAPVVAAAASGSFVGQGFADMVESPGGHGHTEAFPVPQEPVPGVQDGYITPVEFVAVDAVELLVPQPRDPGDVAADPSAFADSVGVHAANPDVVAAPEWASPTEPGGSSPEAAPDPLAGGLLAHLMSSVRGL